jgi:hypothetical protein
MSAGQKHKKKKAPRGTAEIKRGTSNSRAIGTRRGGEAERQTGEGWKLNMMQAIPFKIHSKDRRCSKFFNSRSC